MSEIARQAGLTHQAIYRKHFRNFQKIIDHIHAMIVEQIHQVYSNYDMVKDANPFDYVVDNVLSVIYEGIR